MGNIWWDFGIQRETFYLIAERSNCLKTESRAKWAEKYFKISRKISWNCTWQVKNFLQIAEKVLLHEDWFQEKPWQNLIGKTNWSKHTKINFKKNFVKTWYVKEKLIEVVTIKECSVTMGNLLRWDFNDTNDKFFFLVWAS